MLLRVLAVLCIAAVLPAAIAQSESTGSEFRASTTEVVLGDDRFVSGREIDVLRPVAGDLIAAGGNIAADAAVSGDAVVAGGNIRIAGPIGGSVYAAGGTVMLDGTVRRSARVAGGRVQIGPRADVAGGVSAAGGEVRLEGTVKGYVQVAGGHVWINGTVGGDVVATAGTVELGPSARIAGHLTYTSRAELRRDPAAQVAGSVERRVTRMPSAVHALRAARRVAGFVWTVGLMLTAALLVAALPALTARVTGTLRSRLGMSLLIGFAALVCIPVAIFLLLVTLIGAPLALLTLALYCALLLLGQAITAIALGDWALGRYRAADAARTGWRLGAAILAVLSIAIVARIPLLGGLLATLVLIAGVGALLIQIRPTTAS